MKIAIIDDSQPTVEEIHKAFHASLDELDVKLESQLTDVLQKRSEIKYSREHHNISSYLPKAKEVVETMKSSAETTALSDLSASLNGFLKEINNLRLWFPYKLIHYAALDMLCRKYNLVIGKSTDYTQSIPKENAQHIANFVGNSKLTTDYWANTVIGQALFQSPFDNPYYSSGTREKSLYIAAPVQFFDTKGKTIIGRELVNTPDIKSNITLQPVIPPDPIVLAPLHFRTHLGGELKMFAIITAWGIEAKDEKVMNPKNN